MARLNMPQKACHKAKQALARSLPRAAIQKAPESCPQTRSRQGCAIGPCQEQQMANLQNAPETWPQKELARRLQKASRQELARALPGAACRAFRITGQTLPGAAWWTFKMPRKACCKRNRSCARTLQGVAGFENIPVSLPHREPCKKLAIGRCQVLCGGPSKRTG